MMDNRILELTKDNQSQRNNRFFLEGKPEAILIVEFVREKEQILTLMLPIRSQFLKMQDTDMPILL